MITRNGLEFALALAVLSYVGNRHFAAMTGLTLDDWDLLNHDRVMNG